MVGVTISAMVQEVSDHTVGLDPKSPSLWFGCVPSLPTAHTCMKGLSEPSAARALGHEDLHRPQRQALCFQKTETPTRMLRETVLQRTPKPEKIRA